jgi:hypothetical protein
MEEMFECYECSFCKLKFHCNSYWKGKGNPEKCPECICEQLIYKYCAIIYLNSRAGNETIQTYEVQ